MIIFCEVGRNRAQIGRERKKGVARSTSRRLPRCQRETIHSFQSHAQAEHLHRLLVEQYLNRNACSVHLNSAHYLSHALAAFKVHADGSMFRPARILQPARNRQETSKHSRQTQLARTTTKDIPFLLASLRLNAPILSFISRPLFHPYLTWR